MDYDIEADVKWLLALPARRLILQRMTREQVLLNSERREFPSVEVKERFIAKLQMENENLLLMKGVKGDPTGGTSVAIIME